MSQSDRHLVDAFDVIDFARCRGVGVLSHTPAPGERFHILDIRNGVKTGDRLPRISPFDFHLSGRIITAPKKFRDLVCIWYKCPAESDVLLELTVPDDMEV